MYLVVGWSLLTPDAVAICGKKKIEEKFGIVRKLYYLCSEKRKQLKRNTMNTVSTILYVTMMLVLGLFVLGIFIQTNKELWDVMKSDVIHWFKNTRMGMNYYNRKNGVKILSDKEFDNILKSGKIIYIDMED
jgi:hypothetical protein